MALRTRIERLVVGQDRTGVRRVDDVKADVVAHAAETQDLREAQVKGVDPIATARAACLAS
jgi:hypothetical protein